MVKNLIRLRLCHISLISPSNSPPISLDRKSIKIVDKDNTGEVQENSRWSEGLHEFLELKHGIHSGDDGFTSVFQSNFKFFKNYGSRLYGLTGTLGSESTKQFLDTVYNVGFAESPTFRQSQFELLPPIATTKESLHHQIVEECVTVHESGRPLLVIVDTINAVQTVEALLTKKLPLSTIVCYARSDEAEIESKVKEVSEQHIIVATNLAGRGTDIDISEEISERGGLHVVLGFLPRNKRVEDQAIGRTARKGQRGSARHPVNNRVQVCGARLIFVPVYHENDEQLQQINPKELLEAEYSAREDSEQRQLGKSLKQVALTTCWDEMFSDFRGFMSSLDSQSRKDERIFKGLSASHRDPSVTKYNRLNDEWKSIVSK